MKTHTIIINNSIFIQKNLRNYHFNTKTIKYKGKIISTSFRYHGVRIWPAPSIRYL
jgi:hypothetical protein